MTMSLAKESEVQCAGSGPFIKLRPFNYEAASMNARTFLPAEKLNSGANLQGKNNHNNRDSALMREQSLMSIL
jgi:hypothetical protein